MMDFKTVTWKTFASGTDDYGQTRQTVATTTQIPMHYRVYSHTNVNDPRYNDCELIGLTKIGVHEGDVISINSIDYNVLFVIESRYNVLLLKKR